MLRDAISLISWCSATQLAIALLENDLETQITNCPTRTVDLSSSSKIQNDLNYIFQLQREFFTFFKLPTNQQHFSFILTGQTSIPKFKRYFRMAIQLIHDVSIFDRKSVLRKGILIGMKFLIISLKQFEKWYFVTKIVLTYCEKNLQNF